MLALKRFVTIVVMVYVLLALLFLLVPAVRDTVAGVDTTLGSLNPLNALKERDFYRALAWAGVLVLALHLVVENLDSSLLRRTVGQNEAKINELKAKLYDHQQRVEPGAPLRPTPADSTYAPPPTDQVV